MRDTGSVPGLERSPGGGKWQPTPVFLPGQSHGHSSLSLSHTHTHTQLTHTLMQFLGPQRQLEWRPLRADVRAQETRAAVAVLQNAKKMGQRQHMGGDRISAVS